MSLNLINTTQVEDTMKQLAARITPAALAIGLFGLFNIRSGWSVAQVSLAGAALSLLIPPLYHKLIVQTSSRRRIEKSFSAMAITGGLFLVFAFGCYLVFYVGIWQLIKLFRDFSFAQLLFGVFGVLLGYRIVYSVYQMSEIGRLVTERVKRAV